jgi:hypothetical protein
VGTFSIEICQLSSRSLFLVFKPRDYAVLSTRECGPPILFSTLLRHFREEGGMSRSSPKPFNSGIKGPVEPCNMLTFSPDSTHSCPG